MRPVDPAVQDRRVVILGLLLALAAFLALWLGGAPPPDETWLRFWGT